MSQSQNSKLSKLTRENSTTVCRAVPKILAFLPLHLGVYREEFFKVRVVRENSRLLTTNVGEWHLMYERVQ